MAVSTFHTWQLPEATLGKIRAMLEEAYGGDFSDADWGHTLGGVHALVWDGDDLIGHGSVVQRQLIHTSQDTTHVLRTGYLEGMAVRADRRRQGVGRAIVVALNEVIRGAYELGALSAADEARRLYAANGWQPWRGRAFALTPHGVEPTADEEEGIFVLPVVEIDLEGNLTCDWREGDVW